MKDAKLSVALPEKSHRSGRFEQGHEHGPNR